jgi:hypothetical protein
MLNLKQKAMKKLLFIAMMCVMSAVTFGRDLVITSQLSMRSCLAIISVKNSGGLVVAYYRGYGSTCAQAMANAKAQMPILSTPILEESTTDDSDEEVVEEPALVPVG